MWVYSIFTKARLEYYTQVSTESQGDHCDKLVTYKVVCHKVVINVDITMDIYHAVLVNKLHQSIVYGKLIDSNPFWDNP